MTTTTPETLTTEAPAPDPTTWPATETAETAETGHEAQEDAQDAAESRGEAAKYRRRLREAEAERDALRTQLSALRRAEVDRIAETSKLKPAALWASGATLDAMLSDEGTVDPVKVAAAIAATRDALGIPPLPAAPSASGQGNVGVPVPMSSEPAASWAAVLRG